MKENKIEPVKDLPKLKPKRRKTILLAILIPLGVILISVFTYGYHLFSTAQTTMEESYEDVGRKNETSTLRAETVDPVDDHVSVLIIGIDESEERAKEKYYRSDTLILATFNKDLGNVKLLSIPRDSRVFVPEVGYETKINHAHFWGGPKSAMETVEEFLNVPVDYFVSLNFNAFIDVVDAIGGIEYNVPYDISEVNTKGQRNKVKISKGYQLLDGEKALALARTRRYDNDIERGKRQQEIIKTIANKVTSTSSVFRIDDLMDAVGSNMKTNLTFKDMTAFFSHAIDKKISIESINLEGSGGYMEDGLWYYLVDEDSRIKAENELRRHLDLPVNVPGPLQ